jgi:hypothetical protein
MVAVAAAPSTECLEQAAQSAVPSNVGNRTLKPFIKGGFSYGMTNKHGIALKGQGQGNGRELGNEQQRE